MADQRVLGIVLAGGAGKRLAPLTADRAKPAVPFGGMYRLVDFALSNLVNGGILRIAVLTQYKSHSLDRHISTTWRMSTLLGNYVTPVPAQQRLGPHWYTGSADAIYQSLNLINDEKPDLVIVFGADHVYRMDPRQMHRRALPARRRGDRRRHPGAADGRHRVRRDPGRPRTGTRSRRSWRSRPTRPALPGRPDEAYASMGNYVFSTDVLVEALRKDAANPNSRHDMGGDIIPMLVDEGCAHVYDFMTNKVPGASERDAGYWRDVGTLDSYFEAHMDLCAIHPVFNLYNDRWPILTNVRSACRRRSSCTTAATGSAGRSTAWSATASSCPAGWSASRCSPPASGSTAGQPWNGRCILHNTIIGRHAVVRDAIMDKNVTVPEGVKIGVDKDHDRERGFAVSDGGITVVGKSQKVTG